MGTRSSVESDDRERGDCTRGEWWPVRPDVLVCDDPKAVAEATCGLFARLARQAIGERGRFAVALSGGSTPGATYTRLADQGLLASHEWAQVHVFWADERCVSPRSPDSNYRLVRETLLNRIGLRPGNVHRLRGELEPHYAAQEYEQELREFFGAEADCARGPSPTPRFDLMLLGVGEDGHTASLFPGSPLLNEERRWVAAEHVAKLNAWRLTLTLPVINAAATVVFLVVGSGKAKIVRRVLAEPSGPDPVPAQLVRPVAGRLLWFLDTQAAALLRASSEQGE